MRTSFLGAASASKGKRLDLSDRVSHEIFNFPEYMLSDFLFLNICISDIDVDDILFLPSH